MTVLYPNPYFNELSNKEAALYALFGGIRNAVLF